MGDLKLYAQLYTLSLPYMAEINVAVKRIQNLIDIVEEPQFYVEYAKTGELKQFNCEAVCEINVIAALTLQFLPFVEKKTKVILRKSSWKNEPLLEKAPNIYVSKLNFPFFPLKLDLFTHASYTLRMHDFYTLENISCIANLGNANFSEKKVD